MENKFEKYDKILKKYRKRWCRNKRTARKYLKSIGFEVNNDGTLRKVKCNDSN